MAPAFASHANVGGKPTGAAHTLRQRWPITNMQGKPPMSDDLRTRIAAVIVKHHTDCDDTVDGTWTQCECDAGWRREDEWAVHLADAVIRELDADYILVPKGHTISRIRSAEKLGLTGDGK
jgi:hypothetical protein